MEGTNLALMVNKGLYIGVLKAKIQLDTEWQFGFKNSIKQGCWETSKPVLNNVVIDINYGDVPLEASTVSGGITPPKKGYCLN